MSLSSVLMGLVPLLVFVIVDSFAGLKAALVTAIIFALAEAGFSYYYIGELDSVSFFSLLLVIILGIMAFYKNSPLFFKLQPVILSFALGFILIGFYAFDKPLFLIMAMKYKDKLPLEMNQYIGNPFMTKYLTFTSLYSGIGLIFHAMVTCYTAFRMNKWWWIGARGIGFYFFMLLAAMAAIIQVRLGL